jgi:hypothetical protein
MHSTRNSYNWLLPWLPTHIGCLVTQNAAMWDLREIIKSLDSFISKTNSVLTLLIGEHTGFGP